MLSQADRTYSRKTIKAKKVIEEFEQTHNHSWYEEIFDRNKDFLDDPALFYRGNTISYRAMFDMMQTLASAMQQYGVVKGSEIPVCMSNTPELVYVMGAASMLGAIINVFSVTFPLDYIKEIVNGCDSRVGFFEDNCFSQIYAALEDTKLEQYILYSLGDSLTSNTDRESVIGQGFKDFKSSVDSLTSRFSKAKGYYDFLRKGEGQKPILDHKVTLEDDFTVTYTSGSTNEKRPKAIVQRVRSFCDIGRFHDPDLTYGLKMKKYRWMSIIPPHSNTNLISCISDCFMQGSLLTLEPIYDASFFLESLLHNRPNIIIATRSFWLTAMKKYQTDSKYKEIKMPFLFMVFAAGEELSLNEEKFLNGVLRKASAGRDFLHLPISPVCFCVGGGDCEHGSILHRLFRAITNFSFSPSSEQRYGMTPFDFVEVAVLDENGNRLGPNRTGRLVADSPCTMRCYKNDPIATEAFFVKDSSGRTWGDMSVYGYMDKKGKVYMRNRIMGSGQKIPVFKIADEVLKTKSILSCEVVYTNGKYIAHVEYLPGTNSDKNDLSAAKNRCEKAFGKDVSDKLLFRIHSNSESFKLTGSGKRDVKALIAEGVEQAFSV
ncbi:MAG: acyl--CoA ligase [Clostridia bacterium]|nr:acyl--CoA ligase [Clostridia bacterium]